MSSFLCCCRRPSSPVRMRSSRTTQRYTSLTVSYNNNIAVTYSTQAGIPYEAPFVPPSGELPVLTDFCLQKMIGQGSFGKVCVVYI